jgi:Tol biopolymer transport system component
MTDQTRFDRVLPGLFDELAAPRTPAYLEVAIERASSGPQRPSWTFPGRWLPIDITTRIAPVARMPWRQLGVLALIGLLLALTLAAYIGSQQKRLPAPFGPAANGTVAIARAGDIYVADRPGGDLRPLVAGPEDDNSPIFSPDGTKLAFMRSTDAQHDRWSLMVADADGTNVVQVATEASLGAEGRSEWMFAPDGRSFMTVAQIGREKRLVIRPVDPAATHTILDVRLPNSWMEISQSGGPSFRPTNAREILIVTQLVPDGPHGIYVYDLATGDIRTVLELADDIWLSDVAWLPDGEHITYTLGLDPHIVGVDGSDNRMLDALRARISPVSNDGTRVVVDVEVADVPGDDSHQRSAVVRIDGQGEPVELPCGLGLAIECAWSWIWSPDDSMLIGTVPHWTSSDRETSLPATYLLADADTGQLTELDWIDAGTLTWQRVAP